MSNNHSYRLLMQGVWNEDVQLLSKFYSRLPVRYEDLINDDVAKLRRGFDTLKGCETQIDNPEEYLQDMASVILETYSRTIFGGPIESPNFEVLQNGYFEREHLKRRSQNNRDFPGRIAHLVNGDLSIHYPKRSSVLVKIPFEGADLRLTESELRT